MNQLSIQKLVRLSLFIAILIVLDLTGLGLIRTPWASITTLHIPVIIGAILLGPLSGGVLGFSFGLISMLEATYRPGSPVDMLFSPFSSANPIASILMCFGPRILLGLVAAYLYKALSATKIKTYFSISISALAATLCHTATVLALLSILFAAFPLSNLLGLIIGVNALLEMAAAILITAAVTYPLLRFSNKTVKQSE